MPDIILKNVVPLSFTDVARDRVYVCNSGKIARISDRVDLGHFLEIDERPSKTYRPNTSDDPSPA
jgi:hypothetical protein